MSEIVGFCRSASEFARADVERELRAAGAERFLAGDTSASARGVKSALEALVAGDTVVVRTSEELSPSVEHFIRMAAALDARGIHLRSLAEPALCTDGEPAPPAAVLSALEQLRRRLISARTKSGLKVAAAEGRHAGRPTVMTEERLAMARELQRQNRSVAQIARVLGVSASAVRRALQPHGS